MFRLHVWLPTILVLFTGAALTVGGTGFLFDELFPPYEGRLEGSKLAIRGMLMQDAHEVVNRVAAVTVDPVVRALVSEQEEPEEADPALAKVLLAPIEGRMGKPVFGMVVGQDGTVLASVGVTPKDMGTAIAGLPLFAEAKLGVVRDGSLRDELDYHVAAAPVVEGREVGVVILGWAIDGAYADRLAAAVDRPLVIMRGPKRDKKEGAAFADVAIPDLARATGIGGFGAPAPALLLPVPGLPFLVSESERYYASGVPVFDTPGAPVVVTAVDRNSAFSAIGNAQLVVSAASLLLALLVAFLVGSLRSAYRKPTELIGDHLSRAAQGEQVGILPEAALKGPLERLGRQINMILQNPGPGTGRHVAPISPSSSSAGFESGGFAAGLSDDTVQDAAPDAAAVSATPPSGEGPPLPETNLAPVSQAPVSEDLENSSLSGLFDDAGDDPLAAFRVGGGPAPAGPPSGPPGPPPPEMGSLLPGTNAPPPSSDEGPSGDRTVAFQVPNELLQESAASGPMSMPPTNPGVSSEDRTVVAEIPSELLDQAAPKPNVADAEEQHYRTVYQEFIDTRQQCGEDTSQLTYDRFVAKLMKNRATIMQKYKSKSVRFQVYVKNNKAALRAVPVRD